MAEHITPEQFKHLFESTRFEHELFNGTYWRHKRTQGIYLIEGLAYDSDRTEIVVQYRPYDERTSEPTIFSHLKTRFLGSFERVELQSVWMPA